MEQQPVRAGAADAGAVVGDRVPTGEPAARATPATVDPPGTAAAPGTVTPPGTGVTAATRATAAQADPNAANPLGIDRSAQVGLAAADNPSVTSAPAALATDPGPEAPVVGGQESKVSGAAAVTAPSVAPATAPTPAASAAPSPAPTSPAHQVATHIVPLRLDADGIHRLTVHLHPADLGPVSLVAEIRDGTVAMQLTGSTDAGREALRAALPDLRRELTESGFRDCELDLRQDGGQPGQQLRQPLGHNARADRAGADQAASTPEPTTRATVRDTAARRLDVHA